MYNASLAQAALACCSAHQNAILEQQFCRVSLAGSSFLSHGSDLLPNDRPEWRGAERVKMQGVGCKLRFIDVSESFRVWGCGVAMSPLHQLQLRFGWPLVEVLVVLIELHNFEHASFPPVLGSVGSRTEHVLDLARGQ